MAVRTQDLVPRDAVVYRFPPIKAARARRARQVAAARRRAALLVAAAGVLGAATLGPDLPASAPRPAAAAEAGARRWVVLRPDDTLWDVARRHAPATTDPRTYVEALWELNGLDGAPEAGQRLRLPR